jgi:hypothetical protein
MVSFFMIWVSLLAERNSETEIGKQRSVGFFMGCVFLVGAEVTNVGEQGQGIANVADGELFHGLGLLI